MEIADKPKQDIVTRITQSNTFKNAPTSNALLQYLHDATQKGKDLKEGVIELEFFGGEGNADRRNPRVRVNVYNLRKKLAHYYETEGKDENWRIAIDKGQYHVRFFKKRTGIEYIEKLRWAVVLPYMGMFVGILALVIINSPVEIPVVWQAFITQKKPTNLFIGDHFGMMGKTITNGTGWTRDFEINNVDEFYALLDKEPELKDFIKPANYSYTTRMAALATQQFERFYVQHHQKLTIRFTTQTSISDIKEGNAIYAGPIKNNNQFIQFFNEGNPYFKISRHALVFSGHPTLKDTIISLKTPNVTEEYAIVSKYKGIGNTEHFVFFSDHDIGVSATAEYFTNVDSLQVFTQTYLKGKEHFTAIFKVKGQDRTNTDLKLEKVVSF